MVAKGGAQAGKSNRYQIIEELGRGGMGVVYKASDTLLDRIIAYKVLPPHVQKDKRILEMFLREARSAARLSHPNIVTIFDADESRGEFYIIMELVEGESLKELLHQQGKFPVKTALVLTAQVFRALAYAHGKGIVHRDIKPANLLWAKSEKLVKITDFGLARVIEEGRKTHTQMAGTPYYMAPEQILGGTVDHQADQYAMGITLYEFLTGTVPFKDGDVLYHHVHTEPKRPETHNPDLSAQLSDFVMKCIAKDSEKRFPDVNAALEELKVLLT
jgi:serine/threonine-protein kinase